MRNLYVIGAIKIMTWANLIPTSNHSRVIILTMGVPLMTSTLLNNEPQLLSSQLP